MPKVKTKLSSSTSADIKVSAGQANSNLLLNPNPRKDQSPSTITMNSAVTNNQVDILLQDLGAEPLFAAVQDQQSKNSFSNVSVQHAPVKQESMEARD
ncbi:15797_t:CDS:1, partial [Racocetra persica]